VFPFRIAGRNKTRRKATNKKNDAIKRAGRRAPRLFQANPQPTFGRKLPPVVLAFAPSLIMCMKKYTPQAPEKCGDQ
jgi:hypothetical protein